MQHPLLGEIKFEEKPNFKSTQRNWMACIKVPGILKNCIADNIQKKIIETAKAKGHPIAVLRGVETYKHIGKHLKNDHVKLSKLNEILRGKQDYEYEYEVEHDILVLAMNSDTLFVTFIQVKCPISVVHLKLLLKVHLKVHLKLHLKIISKIHYFNTFHLLTA